MDKKVVPVEMEKLESFGGSEFNSWKRKTEFGLRYLQVYYTVQSDFANNKKGVDLDQWNEDNDFSKNYLLNCLSNSLADTYSRAATAKEIWDNLEAQFRREEELSKSHLVEKFLAYKFQDEKEITLQLAEMEILRSKLSNEKIEVCDPLFVGLILFKLPSTWQNFRTEMYRRKEQVRLDELKRFIRVEDENRARNNLEMVSQYQSTANAVSTPKKYSKPSKSAIDAHPKLEAKKSSFKKRIKCHNCAKWGHYASECRLPRKERSSTPPRKEANIIDNRAEPSNFVAMVRTSRSDSSSEWNLDKGAICHACNTKLAPLKHTMKVASESDMAVNHTAPTKSMLSSG